MATYRQTYSYYEDGYGTVTEIFIISDSYAGLTSTAYSECGCFELDELAEDLDVDTGVFASDQLSLTADEFAIETTTDRAAIDFLLSAQNTANRRFVGWVINPANALALVADDFAFRGVVNAAMSADDGAWSGNDYDTTTAALRVWKITATSVDIAALLEVDLPTIIEAVDSTWRAAKVKDRLGYYKDGDYTARWANLVSWEELVQKLLDVAVSLTYGTGILTITYEPNLTDLRVFPARYYCRTAVKVIPDPHPGNPPSVAPVVTRYPLRPRASYTLPPEPFTWLPSDRVQLNAGGTSISFGSLFLSWRLLAPSDEEKDYSWLRYKSLGALIYAVAAGLGCYPEFRYQTQTDIRLKFIPRSQLATTALYFRDATDSTIDVQSLATDRDKRKIYGGASWQLVKDGPHQYNYNGGFYEYLAGLRAPKSDAVELAPLTISPTWCFLEFSGDDRGAVVSGDVLIPHNVVFWDTATERKNELDPRYGRVALHSGMYVTCLGSEATGEVGTQSGGVLGIWSPVALADTTLDGLNFVFSEITTWLNRIYHRDDTFYATERQITVPGLCGFRQSPTGGNDWRFARRRCTVTIDGQEFVVVGVTRSSKEKETKLRLHHVGRFAFVDTTPGTLPDAPTGGTPDDPTVLTTTTRKMVVGGEDIAAWSVVTIDTDGKAYRANPTRADWGKQHGIALADFDYEVDTVPIAIQMDGTITLPDSFPMALTIGKRLYVRLWDGATNLSHNPLTARTSTEDLYLQVGIVVDVNKIKIGFDREYILQ